MSAGYFWPLPSRAATLTIALSAAKSISPALARFLRTVSPHVRTIVGELPVSALYASESIENTDTHPHTA